MSLTFCPGHVGGRVMMLSGKAEAIRSVFEVVKVGICQEEFNDDEEGVTLMGLIRMGLKACDEIDEVIRVLSNLRCNS